MMSGNEHRPASGGLRHAVFVVLWLLQGVALSMTAYLLWIALREGASPAGCAGSAVVDCEHVLASRWSRVAGLPVALPALLVYLLMFVATGVTRFSARTEWRFRAWWVTTALAASAAGAAGWFVALQLALLGSVCLYCLVVHMCGLLLMTFVLVTTAYGDPGGPRLAGDRRADGLGTGHAVTVGLAGVAVLIAVQTVVRSRPYVVSGAEDLPLLAAGPESDAPSRGGLGEEMPSTQINPSPAANGGASVDGAPGRVPAPAEGSASPSVPSDPTTVQKDPGSAETRLVSFLDGKFQLRPSEHVRLGPATAEWVIVELFDYTCSKCREMHAHLEAARARYGDRLAVVLISVPLNSGCNPTVRKTQPVHEFACLYARLALAVWKNNPEAFPEFHQWLFDSVTPPPPGIARSRAGSLLPDRGLFQEANSKWVQQRLDEHIELSRRLGGASVPKLVVGDRVISGSTGNRDEFFELLQAHLKPAVADQQSRWRKRQPVR